MTDSDTDETGGTLGGRLALLDDTRLGPGARALADHMDRTWVPWAKAVPFEAKTPDGAFIGPFNPLLLSPEIGGAFLALQEAENANTTLTRRCREIVILSVGSVWRSAYELYAHTASAASVGLAPDEIEALLAGEPSPTLSADETLAQHVALELAGRREVTAGTYARAREAFGERGVLDLVLLGGCYGIVCGLLNAFAIPAPPA